MPQHPDPIIRALRHIASPSNKKASNKEKLEATRLLIDYQREVGQLGSVSRKKQNELSKLFATQLSPASATNASGDELAQAI